MLTRRIATNCPSETCLRRLHHTASAALPRIDGQSGADRVQQLGKHVVRLLPVRVFVERHQNQTALIDHVGAATG